MTWDEVFEKYLYYLQHDKKYGFHSIKYYQVNLKQFRLFLDDIGINDVRQVDKTDILNYQKLLSDKNYSAAARIIYIRAVKKLYEYLITDNHILLNPCENIKLPSKNRNKYPKITVACSEKDKIISMINLKKSYGIRDIAMIELLFSTGIRAGECASLLVYDIDTQNKLVKIKKSVLGLERVIPIESKAVRWIKEYQQIIRPRLNRHNPNKRNLFLKLTGEQFKPTDIQNRVHQYVKEAGIKKRITCQTIRNSYVDYLIKKGVDIVTIQKLLGHRRLNSTLVYLKK